MYNASRRAFEDTLSSYTGSPTGSGVHMRYGDPSQRRLLRNDNFFFFSDQEDSFNPRGGGGDEEGAVGGQKTTVADVHQLGARPKTAPKPKLAKIPALKISSLSGAVAGEIGKKTDDIEMKTFGCGGEKEEDEQSGKKLPTPPSSPMLNAVRDADAALDEARNQREMVNREFDETLRVLSEFSESLSAGEARFRRELEERRRRHAAEMEKQLEKQKKDGDV